MATPEELPSSELHVGLPRILTPARAAEILRGLGLEEMTECALRTRAYRKQIPFHRNGHRIFFTMNDICEIAQGIECRPVTVEVTDQPEPAAPSPRAKRSQRRKSRLNCHDHEPWRARRPRDA